jgi:hypothetical protein
VKHFHFPVKEQISNILRSYINSRESSFGAATGSGLGCLGGIGVRLPAADGDFSLLDNVQTGPRTLPAFYRMGTGDCFLWLKRLGGEADHSPPSSAVIMNGRDTPPLPISLHDVVLIH